MKIQFCEPVSDTVEATREQVVEWLRQTIRRVIKPYLAEDADPVCEEWEDWARAWMQGKPGWKSGEDAMGYLEGELRLHGSMSMEFFHVQRAEALTRAAVLFDKSVPNSMVYEQSTVFEILKWVLWGSHHQEVVERRQQYNDLIEIIKGEQQMDTEPVDTFIALIESISETSLQREVAHVILLRRENAAKFMEYVREYGSRQADVIELWWTSDILTFHRHHQHDIELLLIQDMQDSDTKEISGVLGERWDHNDPFARDKNNRFTLAYYGFDRTVQFFAKVIEEAKEGVQSQGGDCHE